MGYDLLSILKLCGLGIAVFCFIGLGALSIAARKVRREFRVKGFLRPPSGAAWLRFLLWKQYKYFDNEAARICFGVSYFCMIGAIVVVTGVVVLLGSEILLNGFGGFSFNNSGYITLPQ